MLDTTKWRSCHQPSSFESRRGFEARFLHHHLRKTPLVGVLSQRSYCYHRDFVAAKAIYAGWPCSAEHSKNTPMSLPLVKLVIYFQVHGAMMLILIMHCYLVQFL